MEQRIGSSSQPLEGAGFDPAFVPGLTSPVSGDPEEAPAEEAVSKVAVSKETAAEESDQPESEQPEKSAEQPEKSEASDSSEESEESEEEPSDGPVFEASDRRAKIVADHKGVRLTLDDQECEFRWDEIGAVETESPRFGKRFTITVHTPDRRWYPIEIEATARARFQEWEEQLDAVLDAYFEEEDAEADVEGDADAPTEGDDVE